MSKFENHPPANSLQPSAVRYPNFFPTTPAPAQGRRREGYSTRRAQLCKGRRLGRAQNILATGKSLARQVWAVRLERRGGRCGFWEGQRVEGLGHPVKDRGLPQAGLSPWWMIGREM